jgi:alkylhydroperoxidase/carboxymuconolactone decarboxylase family protein YurZ
MTTHEERLQELKKKYGATAVDNASRLNAKDLDELMEWRDEVDPHYTKLWLDFTYGGLYARGILDERTRHLVTVAQFVAQDDTEMFESHARSALGLGVSPRELLEVTFQTTVYVGYPKGARASRILLGILKELGRVDEIVNTQLPIEGRNPERSLERERGTWGVSDAEFPRREELMQKYGWHGISAGLRLQPTHHPAGVERLDRVDPPFLKLWLDFIYGGLYVRGVLDDKTRLLCMVGICIVIDEQVQGENHVRAALMLGATPREVLEVALQSTIYTGMPRSLRFIGILNRVLEEQGRMSELTETRTPLPGEPR